VPGDETLLRNFQETVAKHPDFDTWFRQVPMPNSDTSALLIARWLCHLGGFRHKTVHLFIDHPTLDNHTLIQVRGLNKAESPGCFDLPMAGHVVRLESVKDTLIKELGEELGLELEELEEITLLGSRGLISNPHPGFHNVEHHVVFRGRLSATGWQNVNANDHEVAAVAIFPLTDLQQMIVRFPNRVASGLKSSLALYTS
jgi:isopentenyldiphosphate isomerase